MMNKEAAIAYGKQIGVRYYVKTSTGGLIGGFTTLEAARECKSRWEKDDKTNPWTKGTTKFIITKA